MIFFVENISHIKTASGLLDNKTEAINYYITMFNSLLYNDQNNIKHDSSVHNKCQYTNLGIQFIPYLLYTKDYTGDNGDLKKLHRSF